MTPAGKDGRVSGRECERALHCTIFSQPCSDGDVGTAQYRNELNIF